MLDALTSLTEHDWQLVVVAGVACFFVGVATAELLHRWRMNVGGAFADPRWREQNLRLDTAVNNMSQGLVMFDSGARLAVCNRRYLEMYGLSAAIVRPGCTLRQLVDHRIETGSFSAGDPAQYVTDLRATMARGETVDKIVELTDGRTIAVSSRPMANGGWVATHEDITER